jgi:hypothetical protein
MRNKKPRIATFSNTDVITILAFHRLTPKLDAVAVFHIIMPLWILKVGFALLDTPFVYYPGVRRLACENDYRSSDSGESRETGLAEVEAGFVPEKSLDSEISVQG